MPLESARTVPLDVWTVVVGPAASATVVNAANIAAATVIVFTMFSLLALFCCVKCNLRRAPRHSREPVDTSMQRHLRTDVHRSWDIPLEWRRRGLACWRPNAMFTL